MEEKKPKIRIFDVIVVLLIAYLCFLVYTIKTENNELNAKLTKAESSALNADKVENTIVEANKTENKVERTSYALPGKDASLEERVAYLEKRLQEDNYARTNYYFEILEYIDTIAETMIEGDTEYQELRAKFQEMIDKDDYEDSQYASGRSHIVLSVEKKDGKYIAHTVHCEETSRALVDFELKLNGHGTIDSYKDIER